MKKLLAVLLTVIMVSALFAGLVVVRADGVTVANHMIDSKGYHPDRTIYTVHGWSVTDTKIKKIGYILDSTGDPYWLIEDVSDVERVGNTAFVQGVDAFNDAFLDSALHQAIIDNNLQMGLTDFYAYRIHVVLDTRDFAVNEQHNFTVVAQFENGEVKNVFRDWTVDLKHKQTIDTYIGDTYNRLTLTTLKNISVEQTEKNELVITSNSTDTSDHFLAVNLPSVDTSLYTSVSIKYKLEPGSTAAGNQTYFKDSATYTSYGATAGTYAAPRYIADGNWHVVTYLFRNDTYGFEPQAHPYAMAGKTLTGIRINCAATGGTMRLAWIKFNNVSSESCEGVWHTSKDQLRNEGGVTLDTGANRDRNSTTLTDTATIAASNYINVYGWVADSQKLYGTDSDFCFGYQYGSEAPVFDQTRYRGADDGTIVAQAGALGLTDGESVRFNVNVPIRQGSDLSFWVLAKMADGSIKRVWHVIYSNVPAVELGVAAFSGVTVNGTSVASGSPAAIGTTLASNPIYVAKGANTLISAAGSAQVHYGYIEKFAYRFDNGALTATSKFIDDSKTVPLKNNGYTDADHDAKGFYRFNADTSALAAGDHTLKLYAISSDASRSGHNEIELAEIPFTVLEPKFSSVSSTIESGNNINLNFKADKKLQDLYTDIYVTFDGGDPVYATVDGDNLVFTYSGIDPAGMDTDIDVVLHATRDGTPQTYELTYSLADYCEGVVSSANFPDELKTLVVDMLNYGAAVQTYSNMAATANAGADQSYATTDANAQALTNDYHLTSLATGKKAKWTAVALRLEDEVSIRYKFEITDTTASNVTVAFTYTNVKGQQVNVTRTLAQCTSLGNNKYVCYLELPASDMRSVVTAVIKSDDTVISSTLDYSIVTYAYSQTNATTPDANLVTLLKEMMKFGDSAKTYVLLP